MVEIIFSNKKAHRDEVKIALAYGKIDKKYLADFLTADEIKLLSAAATRENFKCKAGEVLSFSTAENKIICVAAPAKPTAVDLQKIGGGIYACIKKYASAVVYAASPAGLKLKSADIACNLAFGLELASYRFDKYVTKRKPEEFPQLESVAFAAKNKIIDKNTYAQYSALATGVRYARDLTNEPSNNLTPMMSSALNI